MKLLLSTLLFLIADGARAQYVIPAVARFIQTDDLGNVYVLRPDNTLTRFTAQGDSSAFYRSVSYGDIGYVDATNPLEPLVYFPKYSRAVLLDRMLVPKTEINLQKAGLYSPPAVCYSADGGIWVYDPFNARIRKLTVQGTDAMQTADLRQQLDFVPTITWMVERNQRLYALDSNHGVLTFDRYGSYLAMLPITGIKSFQVINDQVIYLRGDSLYSFHTDTFRETALPLPQGTLDARYSSRQLYLRKTDGVHIAPAP